MNFEVSGNLVDIFQNQIYPATITIQNGIITKIHRLSYRNFYNFIIPPFIDSHIHIESSMLPPMEFARQAVRFGTVATVSDPHEIANVLGIDGVVFMYENGTRTDFKFYFGAPSCVPATSFESAGAKITADEIQFLMKFGYSGFLSEMMNYPGVLNNNPEISKKLEVAKHYKLPIDGHSPALRGEALSQYISKGISTDHESLSYDEAKEKIQKGMKILIREGSAAKNFDTLIPLLKDFHQMIMFCSDDLHPNDLIKGHINLLVKRAISYGYNLFDILRAVSFNPVVHYNLDVGLLRVGDDADFVIIDNLTDFNILETYIRGKLVSKNGESLIPKYEIPPINNFKIKSIEKNSFVVEPKSSRIQVIEAIDGELITKRIVADAYIKENNVVSNPDQDILKIAVINRYYEAQPAIGFIKNFGLKNSAIASSIAHDSHNIIAVGSSDELLAKAVKLVIENKGGLAFASEHTQAVLPLPIAGLMGTMTAEEIATKFENLERLSKKSGSNLTSPFMTLSFMSLLVIPSLKLSDKGLFDSEQFRFTDLFVD